MPPNALFWLTIGPCVAAVVVTLFADALARHVRSALMSGAALLAAASAVSFAGALTVSSSTVAGAFTVGGGVSTLAGFVVLLTALALAGAVGSPGSPRGLAPLGTLAATGAVVALLSHDLGVTVLALETTSVCSYALVALGASRRGAAAALRYFVQGSVATALLVTGLAVVAAVSRGDLRYASLSSAVELIGVSLPLTLAFVLVSAAIAFKAGSAPFHAWVPDAYGSARPASAAVLAGPVKLAAAAALGIIVARAVPVSADIFSRLASLGDLLPLLAALSLVSMLIGSFGALGERSYTRMLGFAGVAQAGYALLAIAALNFGAAAVHLAFYACAATGAFVAAEAFRAAVPRWDGSIEGLRGIANRRPVLAAAVTVCMTSLAGIPALAGFWGKFQVFGSGVAAVFALSGQEGTWHAWMYLALVVAAVVSSLVSVGYYGGVMRALYAGADEDAVRASAGDEARGAADGSEELVDGRPGRAERLSGAGVVTAIIAVILVFGGLAPFAAGLAESLRVFIL